MKKLSIAILISLIGATGPSLAQTYGSPSSTGNNKSAPPATQTGPDTAAPPRSGPDLQGKKNPDTNDAGSQSSGASGTSGAMGTSTDKGDTGSHGDNSKMKKNPGSTNQ